MTNPVWRGEQYAKKNRFQRRWYQLTMVLASIVVFCTTYALILPAITMEQQCQIPEHLHTDSCYTQITTVAHQELACHWDGHTMVIHQHDSYCYDENGTLQCDLPEVEEHTHDETCYQQFLISQGHTHSDSCDTLVQGELLCQEHVHTESCYSSGTNLICTEPVTEGHAHGEGCLDEEGNLICALEESPGHSHGETCYETQTWLSCGFEGDHVHTDTCYSWELVRICNQEECDPVYGEPELICPETEIICHAHDDNCYNEDGFLICEKPEVLSHQHNADCWQTVEEPVDTETLTCGQEEGENHTHTARCRGTWVLTCGLEEHAHTEECMPKSEDPTYYCGKEAHTHGEGCCDAEGNLTCQQEEHTHTDDCLTELVETVYYCGKEEHTHGQDCCDAEGNLTCQQEEHTHTDDCLTEPAETVYYCGKEAHTHGETCYDAEGNVLCLLEEHTHTDECLVEPAEVVYYCGKEAHAHGETCYDAEGNLLCLLEEHTHTEECLVPFYYCGKEEHTHSESCYDENNNLICNLEEHTHTEECWTPPTQEELEAIEAQFRQEVEALEALETLTEEDMAAAEDLLERMAEAFRTRHLSEDAYRELYERVMALLIAEYDSIAEACEGTNWMILRDSGWFQAYSGASVAGYQMMGNPGIATAAALDGDTSPSSRQIDSPGGTNSADDVTVSKTIAGTDLENVFDITLTVQTPQKIDEVISEPDMAVVIVMDISNTMKDNFGGVTRYAAAMEAAEDFLDNFAKNNTLGVSKVGYVAFNTDAHQIFGLQSCTNETQANALKNTMRSATGSIINANSYGDSHSRFTNIEAGLKMAQDMLAGVSNKNKFIILLTDGFPTTYVSSGYSGYDPYDTTGKYFYDAVLNKKCLYGTSYSDKAAIRARERADSIKSSGTTIFSIGVDVGGQTIQKYITDSEKSSGFSVVDRTGTTYEIGDASSTDSYKNWLRSSIGSGYYYDSTNTAGLKDAYNQIFAQIKTTIETATAADWVASDPIPSITPDEIDFIGLFDKDGTLQGSSLTGSHAENAEDTASYGNSTITWDLKKSGYTVETGGTTIYSYELKYRIRLKNEDSQFVEKEVYNTNGTTTLQYRVIQTTNGTTTISESKTIEFPIPSVHGFLGELEFKKLDSFGRAVTGAEFTLHHAEDCNICRGDKTRVEIADRVAVSEGEEGTVSFANIPSGHTYTLTETGIPPGYSTDGSTYTVTVAYDQVTVKVTGKSGENKDWNGIITNNTAYELPATGGSGTIWITGLGLALCLLAALGLIQRFRWRKGEGDLP